jgi:hypothetical protein
MNDQAGSKYGENERIAIAAAIKKHLYAKGLSRKQLERSDLSRSTIDKALAGDFSDATLTKIEAILSASFVQTQERSTQAYAAPALGGYAFQNVQEFIGSYISVRPTFRNPSILSAYLIEISWDSTQDCLTFREKLRADAKYSQTGVVYMPFGRPFLYLVTIDTGAVRTIIISEPHEEGVARGIITTLANPTGSLFIPATAPIVLKRLRSDVIPKLGYIDHRDDLYSEFKMLLESVITEQYGLIISGVSERRKGLAVVG